MRFGSTTELEDESESELVSLNASLELLVTVGVSVSICEPTLAQDSSNLEQGKKLWEIHVAIIHADGFLKHTFN